jgi:PKD domain.
MDKLIDANITLKINNVTISQVFDSELVYDFTPYKVGDNDIEIIANNGVYHANYRGKITVLGPISYVLELNDFNAKRGLSNIDLMVRNVATRFNQGVWELGWDTIPGSIPKTKMLKVFDQYLGDIGSPFRNLYDDCLRNSWQAYPGEMNYPGPIIDQQLKKMFEDAGTELTKESATGGGQAGGELAGSITGLDNRATYTTKGLIYDYFAKDSVNSINNEKDTFSQYIVANQNLFLSRNQDEVKSFFLTQSSPMDFVERNYVVIPNVGGLSTQKTMWQMEGFFDGVIEQKGNFFLFTLALLLVVILVCVLLIASGVGIAAIAGTIASCFPTVMGVLSAVTMSFDFLITFTVVTLLCASGPVSMEIAHQYHNCNDVIKYDFENPSNGLMYISAADTTVNSPTTLNSNYNSLVVSPDGKIVDTFRGTTSFTPSSAGSYNIYSVGGSEESLYGQVGIESFQAIIPDLTMNVFSEVSGTHVVLNVTIHNNDVVDWGNLTYIVAVGDHDNNIVYSHIDLLTIAANATQTNSYSFDVSGDGTYLAISSLSLMGVNEIQNEKTIITVGDLTSDRVIIKDVGHSQLYSPLGDVVLDVTLQSLSNQDVTIVIPEFNYSRQQTINGIGHVNVNLGALPPEEYMFTVLALNSSNTSMVFDLAMDDFIVEALDVGIATMALPDLYYMSDTTVNASISLRNLNWDFIDDANVRLKVTDPEGNNTIISAISNGTAYTAQFVPYFNGTYRLTVVADKTGYRMYNETSYIIVGQSSRIRSELYSDENVTCALFYANGELTGCNVTLQADNGTGMTMTSMYVSSGVLFLDGLNNVSFVADKMFFEPAYQSYVLPVAAFQYTSSSRVVNFNAGSSHSANGDIINYRWDFGDQTNTSTNNSFIDHTYTANGVYKVVLTVTDRLGIKSTTSVGVYVNVIAYPNASLMDSDMPAIIYAKQPYNVSINVMNTGTIGWNASSGFMLEALGGSHGDAATIGPERVFIAPDITVLPGQTYSFQFTLEAPSSGSYHPAYRMLWAGYQQFGVTFNYNIDVLPELVPDARLISDTIPADITAEIDYPVNITMMNSGTVDWSDEGGFKLVALGGVSGDAARLGPMEIPMDPGVIVLPGQLYSFDFTLNSPASGVYYPAYIMVREDHGSFGNIVCKAINVSSA